MIAEPIRAFRMPRYTELPDVGLYLEQTTKYINSFLAPLGCMEITSSMVSNYVKKDLIPNPVKKQYYAEHIAYLFFVVIAKNLMSMENIAILIDMQRNSYSLPVSYNYLCDEMENMIAYTFGLQESPVTIGTSETDEKGLLRSLAFSAANVVHLNACFNYASGDRADAESSKGKKKK